jgi:hypothetical protein
MCQYKQTLFESTGPGNYQLGTPPIDCDYCYPYPPTVRLQKAGNSIDRSVPLVDTSSDLLNITRKASKCCKKQWNGTRGKCGWLSKTKYEDCPNPPPKCGEKNIKESFVSSKKQGDVPKGICGKNLTHWEKCFVPAEDSRLSDPACNLRGTGFDRWEWLCLNPQEKALVPFDYNISNRIVVKDNHRPCVPNPIDQRLPLPTKPEPLKCEPIEPVCGNPTKPRGVTWKDRKF